MVDSSHYSTFHGDVQMDLQNSWLVHGSISTGCSRFDFMVELQSTKWWNEFKKKQSCGICRWWIWFMLTSCFFFTFCDGYFSFHLTSPVRHRSFFSAIFVATITVENKDFGHIHLLLWGLPKKYTILIQIHYVYIYIIIYIYHYIYIIIYLHIYIYSVHSVHTYSYDTFHIILLPHGDSLFWVTGRPWAKDLDLWFTLVPATWRKSRKSRKSPRISWRNRSKIHGESWHVGEGW